MNQQPPPNKQTNTDDIGIQEQTPLNNPALEIEAFVDESILTQMIKDTSADVIPILIDHYLEESQLRLNNIDLALSDKNLEQLEFETHTLGSSALALGNHVLSRSAREIERLCLEGKPEQAFEKVDSLQNVARKSLSAISLRKELGFSESSS
ncbi:Hpt domain-containing protein [Vibrio sp. 10N.261.55.A7]|uniref:Hpt domain-containing protein n=1 Tax=Vibrio sp. 10N.261.55.A7 TaxID=1880851 RepID=UPI000C85C36A|nr:Hpt domain-containing protein [Vibrio sp. 10N.261.55.A7]